MPIQIHNSLTRKKEEFLPLKYPEVKMYVCGPTVYDQPHIGHARSAYIFDVIRRYLVYKGYKVFFVRNVTDVDDKIIDKARQEFNGEDLNCAVLKVSNKYLDAYHADMELLGIMPPDKEPKATEYVSEANPKMQRFIEELIKREAAYVSGGDVYFDITKAKDYGKLSNQSQDNMEVGVRVAPGEKKRDPLDFALWKGAKENEPSWDSPWGKGRPGWHIECSVMSSDILGDEFDIHGGGVDLIFPHHENEIAQSEGAGKKFARYWIHHGLLTINAQKMSKSLGNFVAIKDFMDKYNNPDLLKLFFLSAHYAHPIDYNEQKLAEARTALGRIAILHDRIEKRVTKSQVAPAEIEEAKVLFIKAMDDDFNTPRALAAIFDLVNLTNKKIENVDFCVHSRALMGELLGILGITLEKPELPDQISESEIKAKIQERNNARKEKDYASSDAIRKELEEKGVILEDEKGNTTWRRKL
ncbi:MAG: cysteine--tRNA ligase [Candidatus Omnitrophica bacterium]|nr:cysteine--tRNA ligase [Candidatus Omnitrophota bacterium]